MKTFKEFMTEIFNSKSKPIESELAHDDGGSHDRYDFKHAGQKYSAQVRNSRDGTTVDVSFKNSKGSMEKTGKVGTHSLGVFSQMKNIIDNHTKKNPKIKQVRFTANKNEEDDKKNSRSALYSRITKRFGGTTTNFGDDMTIHTIPVKKKKKNEDI